MIIHQTLHGYQQGHSLLASSTELSQADKKRMSKLSDWTEYTRGGDSDASYITAYPLSDSPYYVVAKTWYAYEKERPGCVWTHSLLIDTTAIDILFDFRALMGCFVRPMSDDANQYNYEEPLEFAQDLLPNEAAAPLNIQVPSLAYWTEKLLTNEENIVLSASSSSIDNQILLLSFLSHLPIGISQSMTFCSGTARMRTLDGIPFSWQITSVSKKSIPSVNKLYAKDKDEHGWFGFLAESILGGGNEIPILMMKFAHDIGAGLQKMQTVIEIFRDLENVQGDGNDGEQQFTEMVKKMARAFPNSDDGVSFKASILSQGISSYFVDEQTFIVKMTSTAELKAFDYSSFGLLDRASIYSSEHSIEKVAGLATEILNSCSRTDIREKVLGTLYKPYNGEEQRLLLADYPEYYIYVAEQHPQLLDSTVWIEAETGMFKKLLKSFLDQHHSYDTQVWENAFVRLISERIDVSDSELNQFAVHIPVVQKIMDSVNTGLSLPDEYIAYCSRMSMQVYEWMRGQQTLARQSIGIVIHAIPADADMVKRSASSDWSALLTSIRSNISIELAIYLFVLAYNLPDSKGAFLFYKKGFYPIYVTAAENRLSEEDWGKIAWYCPKPLFGWEWDRCAMMRRGFANWIVERGVNESEAKRFTPDRKVNKKLIKAVNKRKDGVGWLPW